MASREDRRRAPELEQTVGRPAKRDTLLLGTMRVQTPVVEIAARMCRWKLQAFSGRGAQSDPTPATQHSNPAWGHGALAGLANYTRLLLHTSQLSVQPDSI